MPKGAKEIDMQGRRFSVGMRGGWMGERERRERSQQLNTFPSQPGNKGLDPVRALALGDNCSNCVMRVDFCATFCH